MPASNRGELIVRPTSRLLPDSQFTTSATYDGSSPRTVNNTSLLSIRTGTVNAGRRSWNTWLPGATSDGEGTARFNTGWLSDRVRGMVALTTVAGNRAK
jgi:hypothetical protein